MNINLPYYPRLPTAPVGEDLQVLQTFNDISPFPSASKAWPQHPSCITTASCDDLSSVNAYPWPLNVFSTSSVNSNAVPKSSKNIWYEFDHTLWLGIQFIMFSKCILELKKFLLLPFVSWNFVSWWQLFDALVWNKIIRRLLSTLVPRSSDFKHWNRTSLYAADNLFLT